MVRGPGRDVRYSADPRGTCRARASTSPTPPGSTSPGTTRATAPRPRCASRAPLELEPTATADLAREYAWSIAKVADATQRTVDASGNATFTYTVTASAGAATDSGWKLQGSVAIANPNQYADGDITADVTAATTWVVARPAPSPAATDVRSSPRRRLGDPADRLHLQPRSPRAPGPLSVTATWDPAGEASSTSVTETTEPITFGGPLGDQQDGPGGRRQDGRRSAGRPRPGADLVGRTGEDLHLLLGRGRWRGWRRARATPTPRPSTSRSARTRRPLPWSWRAPRRHRRRPRWCRSSRSARRRLGQGQLPGNGPLQAGQPLRRRGHLQAPRGQEGAQDRREVAEPEAVRHDGQGAREGRPEGRGSHARQGSDPEPVCGARGPARHRHASGRGQAGIHHLRWRS